MSECHVAIIGAGPYGLSIAAHLKAAGVNFRIFGSPMSTWKTQMPRGMKLKSEGFASSLYDPDSSLTLGKYCDEQRLPYADIGSPVPLETFIAYGMEFQKRFVPELEDRLVTSIRRNNGGLTIALNDGEVVVAARKVVVAAGISHFGYVPPVLSALPEQFVTHSSKHAELDQFKGREVVVVGAGASALDLAALLHQAGASVHVIARKPAILFHDPPSGGVPGLFQQLRRPMTGIGFGWKLFFCTNAPRAFRQLPESYRLEFVKKTLGPAPGWFVKGQVVGKMPFHLKTEITRASVENGRVSLDLSNGSGPRNMAVDHVIAATGYRVDLRRLTFLNAELHAAIRSVEQTPILSSNFESSVPGLYFVGAAAANAFGPLLRFAYGAGFTARQLTKHLTNSRRHKSVQDEAKSRA